MARYFVLRIFEQHSDFKEALLGGGESKKILMSISDVLVNYAADAAGKMECLCSEKNIYYEAFEVTSKRSIEGELYELNDRGFRYFLLEHTEEAKEEHRRFIAEEADRANRNRYECWGEQPKQLGTDGV